MAEQEHGDFNYLHKHIKIYLHVEQFSMKPSLKTGRVFYKIKTVRKIHTESSRKVKRVNQVRTYAPGRGQGIRRKERLCG